ncbi:putative uncharacterized protein [Mycoplasma sp. CAG:776]|nr:putative uncharacterized protein [Mycoplasma sp. CAG:776]
MNIGEKIYNLRKKKNMSQEDLASVLNVSRQTISKWETGESNPDIDKIVPLCNFFEISTDEFLKGKDITYERKITKEKRKNKALTFSLCVLIFSVMIILCIILPETQISENMIGAIIMFCLTAITIILIYYFVGKENEKELKRKKDKKETIISTIIYLITIATYFLISILFKAWAYSWVILIMGIIVNEIIKLIRTLGGEKNE